MAPPEMVGARLGPGWRALAWAVRLARLDARRPAAGVSLATAGLVTWLLAGETAAGFRAAAGIGAGGLLAVAAIGVPAAGMPDGRRRPWATAWLMRAAWPLSGAIAAAAIVGGGPLTPLILAVAAVATTATALAAVAAGATEAAAMAVSLAVTGAAAVASLAAGCIVPAPSSLPVAAAAATWGLVAAAAWFAGRDEVGWSSADAADHGGSAPGRRMTLAPGMPRSLVGAALITSLVTMVVCCFLVPAFSRLYAAVAGGWFLCLAVPLATTGVGGAGGRRLAAAAPGRPGVPGSIRRGIAVSAPILGVLGWPAVVALALPAADGSRSGGPLAAILVLAGAWLLLAGAVASCGRRGGELARAMVLGAGAVAAAGLPGLPGLPCPTGVSRLRSVLSPATDPAKLPGRRSHLEPPGLPRGPAVDVEISSLRSR